MAAAEKTATISRMILERVGNGESIPDAFDAVLGTGRYQELAGEVYDALRDPDAIVLEADKTPAQWA